VHSPLKPRLFALTQLRLPNLFRIVCRHTPAEGCPPIRSSCFTQICVKPSKLNGSGVPFSTPLPLVDRIRTEPPEVSLFFGMQLQVELPSLRFP